MIRASQLTSPVIKTELYKTIFNGYTVVVMVDHQPDLKKYIARAFIYDHDTEDETEYKAALRTDSPDGYDTLRETKLAIVRIVNRWIYAEEHKD